MPKPQPAQQPKAQPQPEPDPSATEQALSELMTAIQPLAQFAEKISTGYLTDIQEVESFPIILAGDWRRLHAAIQKAQTIIAKE